MALFATAFGVSVMTEDRRTKAGKATLHDRTDQLQILDAVANGVTAQDASGVLVYANEAAASVLGYRCVEELLAALPQDFEARWEVLDEGGAPLAARELPGVFSLGGLYNPETVVRLRRRELRPESRWLRVRTRPVLDDTGKLHLAVSVFDDISERRRIETERARLLASERAARGEAEASAEALWAISNVTDVALSHLPLDELLDELLGRVRETLSADTASVFLLTPEGKHLVIRSASGWDPTGLDELQIGVGEGFIGRVAATQRPLALERADDQDLPASLRDRSGVVSIAGVPLVGEHDMLGVLEVGCRSVRTFEHRDLGLLQLVADRVSYAIERTRLFEREHLALERAELALERISRLLAFTAALSRAVTPSQMAEIVIDEGLSAMGAAAGVLALTEAQGNGLVVVKHAGYTDAAIERWHRIDLDANVPLAEAAREGQLLLLSTRGDLESAYPAAKPILEGHKSFAAIPLLSEGRSIGVLGLSFTRESEFPPVERAFMSSLGHQCAQALDRARLYEAAQIARAQAERGRDRITFLAQASEILGGSLDYRNTLERVARLAVPRIADWCAVELAEDQGDPDRSIVAATSEDRAELFREIRRRYPASDGPRGLNAVMRTGVSEIHPWTGDETLRQVAQDEQHFESLRALSLRSSIAVPIKSGADVLGTITFASSDEKRLFDPEDLPFAEGLARRAAASIENARLYNEMEESRERFAYLAVTLQRSLLPQSIAEIPGVETAVRYRAAAEGTQVGGDFYDLFPTDDGRWGIVIGDVCGKGARAAALTGLARHTIRSVAALGSDPSVILDRLNDAIMREGEDDRGPQFCTVAYATLERDDEALRLKVSAGGHPLPLLLRSDGRIERAGRPGLLLGVFEDPEVTEHEIALRAGDAILFYTDGVTESRRGTEVFGDRRLSELVSGCAGMGAEDIVAAVEGAVTEFSGERTSDDIAIMALRVLP